VAEQAELLMNAAAAVQLGLDFINRPMMRCLSSVSGTIAVQSGVRDRVG